MDRSLIDAMDARINRLGADLFFDPLTVAAAAASGVDNPLVLYAGRVGVMGDVTAEQAVSALCFFDPALVHDVWGAMAVYGPPSRLGEVFASSMRAAAEQQWDPSAALVVARLGGTVITSVAPMGMALFAGWRSVAADGSACAVVHALRELRGDIHIQSVASVGLGPADADMATRGAAGMQLHGWKPPYPDPSPFMEPLALATAATSQRMESIYRAALSPTELGDLADAVTALSPAR